MRLPKASLAQDGPESGVALLQKSTAHRGKGVLQMPDLAHGLEYAALNNSARGLSSHCLSVVVDPTDFHNTFLK